MRPLQRHEILDPRTYEEIREDLNAEVLEARRLRRIDLGGDVICFFENHTTLNHQIQEILRAHRVSDESEIQRQLALYNDFLGGPGELTATLLVGLEQNDGPAAELRRFLDLPERIYLKLNTGKKVYAQVLDKRIEEERLFVVQHLNFAVEGKVPHAIGCDHPELTSEIHLTVEQLAALATDVSGEGSTYGTFEGYF
jgi:hypothetical protein